MAARKEQNWAAQGRRFEHEVIHDLSAYGYDCIRSAASKGKVDVVAIAPSTWRPFDEFDSSNLLFIQCKRTDPLIPPSERVTLLDLAARAAALPLVAHRVDGKVHYRELTGPGPKDWKYWFTVWCECGNDNCKTNQKGN